jgi:hypothetical protein
MFRPGKWYPADYEDADRTKVRLEDGGVSATWDGAHVEIRSVGDDEWEVRAPSRMSLEIEGQTLEYPARLAECPEGHLRPIPSRFDARVVELQCGACRKGYRLVAI